MRMQTPLMLQPTQHPRRQRSGIQFDLESARQLCDLASQSGQHLPDVCQHLSDQRVVIPWPQIQDAFLHGSLPPWLVQGLTLGGIGLAFRNNLTTLFENQTAKNKALQARIQNNINVKDLTDLSNVTQFSEKLPPVTIENETPEKMAQAEDFITAIQAQLASGENRRGSSIAKTANANISGLWIKNADAPAVYGDKRLGKAIRAIEASRVSYDKTGKPLKDKATIKKHI